MLLTLIRDTFTPAETLGKLLIDGKLFCDTLEPPVVPNAQHPKGAIPEGWYKIQVTHSPKFGRLLPLLYYVPGFEGIRIHAGNNRNHTSGCILVGERAKRYEPFQDGRAHGVPIEVSSYGVSLAANSATIGTPCLYSSRRTEETLTQQLIQAQKQHEEIYINITDIDHYPSSEQDCDTEFSIEN